MIESWSKKKNRLCLTIKAVSDQHKGDDVAWLREYCREQILLWNEGEGLDAGITYFQGLLVPDHAMKEEDDELLDELLDKPLIPADLGLGRCGMLAPFCRCEEINCHWPSKMPFKAPNNLMAFRSSFAAMKVGGGIFVRI